MSGTKDAHSTPHRNWKGHHQAQTPRWRGLGVYASPRRWHVRGWGSCVEDPLDPQPLHLQTDTQEETAGRTGQDRHKITWTRQTPAQGHMGHRSSTAGWRGVSKIKVMEDGGSECFMLQ